MFLALAAVRASADPVWLTILGDPSNPMSDTVQVDATSAVAFERARVVTIRANRAQNRPGRDWREFRSYVSSVLIDCASGTARHRAQTFYTEPLWTGASRFVKYNNNDAQIMAFRGMDTNPKDRIIRAACMIDLVKSN